jgi:predicted phosphodiesterase
MRIIALGDTHGRLIWKEIVKKEADADKIIFIGDYFDTHYDVSGKQQIDNFKEIVEFKKNNIEKVVLLVGNHDFHYMKGIPENYSGYQSIHSLEIGELLEKALREDLLQMCFTHGKYVFTHAGVTKTWAKANDIDLNNLEGSINDLFKYKPLRFCFTSGWNYSQTGDDVTQTPIWVRLGALNYDAIDDIVYVVGHTTHATLNISSIFIAIDTLGTSEEYLELVDGKENIKKL